MSLTTAKLLQRVLLLIICYLIVFCLFILLFSLSAATEDALTSSAGAGVQVKTTHDASIGSSHNVSKLLQDVKDHDNPWKLIDMQNFYYIMNLPACDDKIVALIAVPSAPTHFHFRTILRTTWAHRSLLEGTPLRFIFLLGAVKNRTVQHELERENNVYGDIVQGSFMDKYANLTYKHTMALKWFIYNCGHAQILIKVDDDAYVNTPQLLKYLKNTEQPLTGSIHDNAHAFSISNSSNDFIFTPSRQLFHHPQNLLFCRPTLHSRVQRGWGEKWALTRQEFADTFYPPYCDGYTVIYSTDVLLRLYEAIQSSKYFWIDDVFITGIIAHRNNITLTSMLPLMLTEKTFRSALAGLIDLTEKEFLITWPNLKGSQILVLWELLELQKYNKAVQASRHHLSDWE